MKYFGVVAALVACAGDDDKESVPGGDMTGMDTSPPAVCYQQDGVDNGQIEIIEDAGTLDSANWSFTPATAGAPATALPGGFDTADFYGAVDPAATDFDSGVWWDGWTATGPFDGTHNATVGHPLSDNIDGSGTPAITASADNLCTTVNADFADGGSVTIFGQTFPVCVVSERITADQTWPNSHVFVLTDTITVGDGDAQLGGTTTPSSVTLTIEAGTQVFGLAGSTTSLVISRGSSIVANGTRDTPIVFGAVEGDVAAADVITGDATDVFQRGQWGGIVLSGFGETNSGDDNGELLTEAAPEGEERYYGGTDNADSSGSIRYAIIAESGEEFRPDEEVQGLTIEAAGSGTTLEYIQVLGSEDDAVEWFGGAASIKYTLNNGPDDDGWDQDLGWVGTIQFGIHVMGSENGDRGIESDNNGGNFDEAPQTAPDIANITIIGDVGKGESSAALHREGWRGRVFRSVYADGGAAFVRGCLDVDDALPSELQYRDVLANCANGALLECDDAE